MIKLGEDIFLNTNTHPLTKSLVGNSLTCESCHLDGGKTKNIGTLIGTAGAFPAYSNREKTVQTLQNRNNNCFMRSMNGIRLTTDSKASIALAAYVTWLSEGTPIRMDPKKPINPYYTASWPGTKWVRPLLKKANHNNYLRGEAIYEQQCTGCHNQEGASWLWGNNSYNTGAGMSKLNRAPMWIQHNMPPDASPLTREDAINITLYINAQPRPPFNLSKHLPTGSSGLYNSTVLQEESTVRSNFEAVNLDVDTIRQDKKIP